jgi:hypothetical protein
MSCTSTVGANKCVRPYPVVVSDVQAPAYAKHVKKGTRNALRGNRTPGGSMATTQVTTTPLMRCIQQPIRVYNKLVISGCRASSRSALSGANDMRSRQGQGPLLSQALDLRSPWLTHRTTRCSRRSSASLAHSRSRSRRCKPRCAPFPTLWTRYRALTRVPARCVDQPGLPTARAGQPCRPRVSHRGRKPRIPRIWRHTAASSRRRFTFRTCHPGRRCGPKFRGKGAGEDAVPTARDPDDVPGPARHQAVQPLLGWCGRERARPHHLLAPPLVHQAPERDRRALRLVLDLPCPRDRDGHTRTRMSAEASSNQALLG